MKNTDTYNFLGQLDVARNRSRQPYFVGHLRMYCENSDCQAREVDIYIKEMDGKVTKIPSCPLCLKTLKTHCVQTNQDKSEEIESLCVIGEALRLKRAHP